mmetsp:Transcript_101863/g.285515  ORF Transcript_101863/g.285515 Transcript_101863/m.285515 type:complete len:202 (-) Transcript_101863:129-734(-)
MGSACCCEDAPDYVETGASAVLSGDVWSLQHDEFDSTGSVFHATLRRRADMPWGFLFEEVPFLNILVVTKLVAELSDDRIKDGDYILCVNNTRNAEEMKDILEQQRQVDMLVGHPYVFTTAVPTGGLRLGMEVRHLLSGLALFVGEVERDGAAAAAGADFRPGDRIIGVDRRTSIADMMAVLPMSDEPEIVVSRVPVLVFL